MSPKPEEGEDFETKLFFPTTSQNEEISDLKKFPPPEQKDEKEQILSAIGIWGKYQLQRCLLILIIIWLPTSFHLLNIVFYQADTDYWCKRPEHLSNVSVEDWKNFSNPNWVNEKDASVKSCKIKNYDYDRVYVGDDGKLEGPEVLSQELIPCSAWEYDKSFWQKTVIMDFDLVCDRYPLRKLQQQLTFMGLMCGVFISGLISDRWGRKRTMLCLLITVIIVGTASSFSPNYPTFLVGIFICGFSSLGYGTVMYVWMMEHVGGKYKTILGAAPHYNFGFWGLMTAVIAYLVPNWRHLQIIYSLPLVVLIGAYWLIPESARWLLANGRGSEAEEIIRHIAQVNGKHLPESFSLTPPKPSVTSKGPSKHGFIQLFMWPNLRKKTLICYYLWFSTALIYYGLTLNSNTLGTELFTTFSIGKLLEFPSITLVIFLLLKTGRRITLILFYSLAGASLCLTFFVPLNYFQYEWPILILNLLGRVSAINTLAVCYVYSAEVFPTVVRTAGLGSSSFWARVGPMIAPFIVELKTYGQQVPLVVFGVIALLAGFLVTFMPETSKTPLPDTIEDGEQIGNGDSLWASCKSKKQNCKA